jgi:hypothetical protein
MIRTEVRELIWNGLLRFHPGLLRKALLKEVRSLAAASLYICKDFS